MSPGFKGVIPRLSQCVNAGTGNCSGIGSSLENLCSKNDVQPVPACLLAAVVAQSPFTREILL